MQNTKACFFAAILCIALLALCACGSPAAPEETTAPTIKTPTLPIQYPASYKAAPEAYWPVLNDLLKFVCLIRDDSWDSIDMLYGSTGIVETPGAFSDDGFLHNLGYAIQDINNDGVPELLLLAKDGFMLSLFTLRSDDKPVLLDSYSVRSHANLAADGEISVLSFTGTGRFLSSYILRKDAIKLTLLTEFFELYMTEEDFHALCEAHYNPPNLMKLDFISIEQ